MTVLNRQEKQLYVTIWYVAGTTMWFPIVYIIGNNERRTSFDSRGSLWYIEALPI